MGEEGRGSRSEDTGPGIPDTMKATLFRRFKKGEAALAWGRASVSTSVRMLIERYSGKIWVGMTGSPGEPRTRAAAIQVHPRFVRPRAGGDL